MTLRLFFQKGLYSTTFVQLRASYIPAKRYLSTSVQLQHSIQIQKPKHKTHNSKAMGKRKSSTPGEENLLLPIPPSTLPIVDTHTHMASTFDFYRGRYKEGKYQTVYEFVKAMYEGRNVEAVVDVWCEAPVNKTWREFADAAADKEKWGGLEYWFVMGESSSFHGLNT